MACNKCPCSKCPLKHQVFSGVHHLSQNACVRASAVCLSSSLSLRWPGRMRQTSAGSHTGLLLLPTDRHGAPGCFNLRFISRRAC